VPGTRGVCLASAGEMTACRKGVLSMAKKKGKKKK
jgi:hypothetical protein